MIQYIMYWGMEIAQKQLVSVQGFKHHTMKYNSPL